MRHMCSRIQPEWLHCTALQGWYLSHARGSAPELLQTMPRGERMSSSTRLGLFMSMPCCQGAEQ